MSESYFYRQNCQFAHNWHEPQEIIPKPGTFMINSGSNSESHNSPNSPPYLLSVVNSNTTKRRLHSSGFVFAFSHSLEFLRRFDFGISYFTWISLSTVLWQETPSQVQLLLMFISWWYISSATFKKCHSEVFNSPFFWFNGSPLHFTKLYPFGLQRFGGRMYFRKLCHNSVMSLTTRLLSYH